MGVCSVLTTGGGGVDFEESLLSVLPIWAAGRMVPVIAAADADCEDEGRAVWRGYFRM